MNDTTERPTLEEAYLTASTTSNLKVETARTGAADILIAAGWSSARLGGALQRLHSDWDRSPKPKRVDKAAILRIAGELKEADLKEKAAALAASRAYLQPPPALGRAQAVAHTWYFAECAAAIGRLHALPAVYRQVVIKLSLWSVEAPEHKAAEIVRWWLNQICPACEGTKLQVVEGTHRHNGKVCRGCSGTGLRTVPHDQVGRKMANYLDSCVADWRSTMGRAMSSQRESRNGSATMSHEST